MPAISNEISAAIKTVIDDNWKSYVPDEDKPLTFLEEEELSSVKVPAIGIFDGGSNVLFETMRGRNADGTPKAGVVMQRYQFDLQVWVKGRRKADTKVTMNEYRAGVKAILQDNFTLGNISADIQVDSDEPSIDMSEGSAALRIGIVRAVVTTWSLQGSTALV